MRIPTLILVLTVAVICFAASGASYSPASSKPGTLQPNSLCATNERIIFSCLVKRPAKIVSVCASKDLTSESGYLQYRFGLPEKLELEFPKDRTATQSAGLITLRASPMNRALSQHIKPSTHRM